MQHYILKENAYKIIKNKILSLEIKPGSRIWEDQLANEISMSRTPVREAINQLASDGYVNKVPRKGVFCIELTKDEIKEILEVREVLEALALKKCIDCIADEQTKTLEQLISEFELELKHERYKKCNKLDSMFHMQIVSITDNKKLIKFIGEIESLLRIARSMELKGLPKAKHEKALEDHKKMLKCIIEKDKSYAERIIVEHIGNMKSNLGIS